ncbi:hypothetical protein ACPOL_2505 [Acidisarcina polymorpha]|uniref:Uncharacterized protein n=1 Tax=Acidisarcina polymorpha TaxID=2211140 RepID=A0A2Z5FZA3_9BACT|nr:hypothetical protein [Acidisarcina polymorpha]AXC11827.1 hypothetical protein ACPOL_2505 [Acidisarcina polymorpha]
MTAMLGGIAEWEKYFIFSVVQAMDTSAVPQSNSIEENGCPGMVLLLRKSAAANTTYRMVIERLQVWTAE